MRNLHGYLFRDEVVHQRHEDGGDHEANEEPASAAICKTERRNDKSRRPWADNGADGSYDAESTAQRPRKCDLMPKLFNRRIL